MISQQTKMEIFFSRVQQKKIKMMMRFGVLLVLTTVSSVKVDQSCGNALGGCSGRGVCMNGKCLCFEGSGDQCEDVAVKSTIECVHGFSYQGKCLCEAGWEGETCEKESCDGCSGHGKCLDRKCVCDESWGGSHCRVRRGSLLL